MPILDRQRRIRELGRIHAGYRDGNKIHKLDKPRLTSSSKDLLEQAVSVYGGEVVPWDEGKVKGRWQAFLDAERIRIAVPPDVDPVSQWYELWSGGGCQRRCDGFRTTDDEPCICRAEQKIPDDEPMPPQLRKCKPTTRMSILLPDVQGLGVWRLESKGANFADEAPGMLDTIAAARQRGVILTGWLRIEHRSSTREGQTRQFVVPVIELDILIGNVLGDGGAEGMKQISVPAAESVAAPVDSGQLAIEAPPTPYGPEGDGTAEANAVIEHEQDMEAFHTQLKQGGDTPAPEEEAPAVEGGATDTPAEPAPPAEESSHPAPTPSSGTPISAGQRRRLFAAARSEHEISSEDVRDICRMKFGHGVSDLTTDEYPRLETILADFAAKGEEARERLNAWKAEALDA